MARPRTTAVAVVRTAPSARWLRQWMGVVRAADPSIGDDEAEHRARELWDVLAENEPEA